MLPVLRNHKPIGQYAGARANCAEGEHKRSRDIVAIVVIVDCRVNHILLPVPSSLGKGVLVSPTIFGNLIAGRVWYGTIL